MKKSLLIVLSIIILGCLNYSCSKDSDAGPKASQLEGSGTWNSPFKLSTGSIKSSVDPGAYLYEFPYVVGETYTVKLSKFTHDLDLRVVIGYGTGMGTDMSNSVTEGLDDEELTYTFSQEDLYLHIENVSDAATNFTISIVKD